MVNKRLSVVLFVFVMSFSIFCSSQIASSDGMDIDTDGDGLTDYEEEYIYHTNMFFTSTDGDKYDDRMEILGTSKEGEQMPWWVKPPGDNVFVAAYPVISVTVSDTISLYEIQEIYTETRNISMTSVGYSLSQTEGSSVSAGTTEGHTYSQWRDVGNEQEDHDQYESYRDRIESSEEKYFTQYTTKNGTEWEIGTGDSYVYEPDYKSSGVRNLTVVVSDGEMEDSHMWLVTVNDVVASEVYVYPRYRKSAVGLEFLVDVRIKATDEVYSAGFELYFDKGMLNATSVEEGDFLNKDSASTYYEAVINNDAGKVTFAGTRAGVYMGVNGTGRLARVRFKSISHGSGDFELGNVEIANATVDLLPYFTSDGTILIKILAGDVNDDHKVSILDLASVGLAYSSRPGDPYWNEEADLNGDWVINIFDLATVGVNYGRRC